ncbi:unnamed protein product [Triticum turgidum subsp. durum]|uniref:VAN3-binding protein-like auxin canalisation domain-containing protein n=1 Tax=Triticum turgidum subsp. durum TaxID=4567 RepID=A0A9R0UX74_TRITD|nr:unnamed protein product [Triticum turgidum subsp. durum]
MMFRPLRPVPVLRWSPFYVGDKMEHFRRGVEFGTAPFQRCHSLSCQMAENTQIDAQKAGIRRKEKSSMRSPKGEEMPVIPEQAMEFLSRTWNPSSSDLFQILTPSCLGASAQDHHGEGETKEDEDGEKELDAIRVDGGKSQLFNQIQTWRVLASGKPGSKQRKTKLNQPIWLNVGQMKALLRGYFLDNVSITGSRRRRRRDELRLHSAQAHAAVSVAQLAAAIAGVVSACDLRGDKKLGAVLASAAALVATVCAEAAESAGANRPRVTSAVKTGLESRSPAELLTLTATAATCLRGAAALKLRAADVRGISTGANGNVNANANAMAMSISASIQKGIALRVCLPCGKVRVRTVSVFPRRGGGAVALRLGRKRLRGAFATYDDHELLGVSTGGGREAVVDGRRCFAVALNTSAGTVQLLLEDQTHCKVWKAAIEGMLSDANLKHAK